MTIFLKHVKEKKLKFILKENEYYDKTEILVVFFLYLKLIHILIFTC